MLPAATPRPDEAAYEPVYYMDALFTAVSATCVTGLLVRDTSSQFTAFGQAVILALIQLGGVAIMLFGTATAMAVGRRLSNRGGTLGEAMADDRAGQTRRLVAFVILTTLALEAVGAALLVDMFRQPRGGVAPSVGEAIWQSVFHSISSFCNAGFSLFERGLAEGVRADWPAPLRDHWQVMGVMAPLIVLGGLGFPVLQDVVGAAHRALRRVRRSEAPTPNQPAPGLSLQSKVVLWTTALLIVLGAAGLGLVEPPPETGKTIGRHEIRMIEPKRLNDWEAMSSARRAREAAFLSVSARSAGLTTIRMDELSQAGKLWMCGLMVVGGSPGGAAGGMKTVTLAVLVLAAVSGARGRGRVSVFGRRISFAVLYRAVVVGVFYLGLVGVVTLLLAVTMRSGYPLIDLLFESCSACGTVGLSTGVTQHLTPAGKQVIAAGMFVGRLGPLMLVLIMAGRAEPVARGYAVEDLVTAA